VHKIEAPLNGPAVSSTPTQQKVGVESGNEFKHLLDELGRGSGLKFSKHAIQRLSSRGISLDRTRMEKLGAAVTAAGDKGANESLVLMDELALIVSVKHRTVITAMASSETHGNVFTSIDSTVIA
jgi:flagellar operon protein